MLREKPGGVLGTHSGTSHPHTVPVNDYEQQSIGAQTGVGEKRPRCGEGEGASPERRGQPPRQAGGGDPGRDGKRRPALGELEVLPVSGTLWAGSKGKGRLTCSKREPRARQGRKCTENCVCVWGGVKRRQLAWPHLRAGEAGPAARLVERGRGLRTRRRGRGCRGRGLVVLAAQGGAGRSGVTGDGTGG